jgi:hypothetical protein
MSLSNGTCRDSLLDDGQWQPTIDPRSQFADHPKTVCGTDAAVELIGRDTSKSWGEVKPSGGSRRTPPSSAR